MPLLLLLLFIGLPLIEIYFLIKVGSVIGALPTIAIAILTAILGTWLVRRQGFGVLMRVRDGMARDQVPALDLVDGALILVAGLFLLLPGFLTDIVGFLLLIPPLRRLLIHRTVRIVPVHSQTAGAERGPRVIEGQWRRED
ncbi:MAG TPA: FxsA family protein [Lamprocystis sp. (in: g-proteobacteria)]|nr:FxsA family protein [Lamprocystis sp. (in: g-proteobacteria)]